MAKILNRTTFRASREMDFFSEKELISQTGHGMHEWPFVILKELVDNALDACEEAGVAPEVTVTADATGITVKDNGPGIPEATLKGAMDFGVRCSNREQYIAPDRGAQGNALMTLLSMPYVLDPDGGRLVIATGGVRHEIVCRADLISQRAIVEDVTSNGQVAAGAKVRVEWSEELDSANDPRWPFNNMDPTCDERVCDRFLVMARGYAFFNPHLTITVGWFGETMLHVKATDPGWKKWRPSDPTSPHWYDPKHLERLIAAYVTHDRDNGEDRTVAAFLAEFNGLTGSKKRKLVLEETGLTRVKLSTLVVGGDLDHEAIENLLAAMRRHTRPVKASRLGVIGKDHFAIRLEEMGGDPEQFEYAKTEEFDDGLPCVTECAFSWLGDDAPDERQIFVGANWSAAISNPFRSFGQTGEGLEGLLREQYAGANEPIVFLLHAACPRVEYADRGKSAIVIGGDR